MPDDIFHHCNHLPAAELIYFGEMEPGKAASYVQGILWGNSQRFLERYFQNKYLK